MTPFKNHAPRDYRMIDAAEMTPHQHFIALLDKGIESRVAAELSGYDEHKAIEAQVRLWAFWACVILVVALAIWLRSSSAAEPVKADAAKSSEAALVACLNGKPIQVGEAYFTCNEMRLPEQRKRSGK